MSRPGIRARRGSCRLDPVEEQPPPEEVRVGVEARRMDSDPRAPWRAPGFAAEILQVGRALPRALVVWFRLRLYHKQLNLRRTPPAILPVSSLRDQL